MTSVGISKAVLKSHIGDIEEAFRYTYSQPQLSKLFDAINGYSPKNLKDAVAHLINTNPPNRPPSNADIIHAVRDYWRQDWEQMKTKENRTAQSFHHGEYPTKTKHANDALHLIRQILSTKEGSSEPLLSHSEIISCIRDMRTKYPGSGWNDCADKLEKKFERCERTPDDSMGRTQQNLCPRYVLSSTEEPTPIRPPEVSPGAGDQYVPPW